jgi:hypothetical protein
MKARESKLALVCATGVAVSGAAGLSGCYEHVVSARGPGADRVDISKPNVPRDSSEGGYAPRTIEHKKLRQRE